MAKFLSPKQEVNYHVGCLYELILENNLKLTYSVNDLKSTVSTLLDAEKQVQHIVKAANTLDRVPVKSAQM